MTFGQAIYYTNRKILADSPAHGVDISGTDAVVLTRSGSFLPATNAHTAGDQPVITSTGQLANLIDVRITVLALAPSIIQIGWIENSAASFSNNQGITLRIFNAGVVGAGDIHLLHDADNAIPSLTKVDETGVAYAGSGETPFFLSDVIGFPTPQPLVLPDRSEAWFYYNTDLGGWVFIEANTHYA